MNMRMLYAYKCCVCVRYVGLLGKKTERSARYIAIASPSLLYCIGLFRLYYIVTMTKLSPAVAVEPRRCGHTLFAVCK